MSEEAAHPPTERSRVRRVPKRASYDLETIKHIIDEALVCHVGFIKDASPHVVPMAVARAGDDVLLHGSSGSRAIRALSSGVEVCVSITHVDAVVVARSAFDSSMNYRSVVVYGRAQPITQPEEKLAALQKLTDGLIPGRWAETRHPTEPELKATAILSLPLNEASAKIRSGPPQDDEADLHLPIWAGEIPLELVAHDPVADPGLSVDVPLPPSVRRFLAERSH